MSVCAPPASPGGEAAERPDSVDDPDPYREPVDAGGDRGDPDGPRRLLELVLLVLGAVGALRVLDPLPDGAGKAQGEQPAEDIGGLERGGEDGRGDWDGHGIRHVPSSVLSKAFSTRHFIFPSGPGSPADAPWIASHPAARLTALIARLEGTSAKCGRSITA